MLEPQLNDPMPSWLLGSFPSAEPRWEFQWHCFGRPLEWNLPHDMCWPKHRTPQVLKWRGLSCFSGTPNRETWFGVWRPGRGLLSYPSGLANHQFHDPRTGSLPPDSSTPCDLWEPLEYTDGFGAGSQTLFVAGSRPFPAPQAPQLCL